MTTLTNFNDMHQFVGPEAVDACITAAINSISTSASDTQAVCLLGTWPVPTAIETDLPPAPEFSTDGKRTKKDGWNSLCGDGVAAGAFGDWRSGLTNKWCCKTDTAMTDFERKAYRDRIKVMQLQRKEETTQSQRHAAVCALQRWLAAEPCIQHDYLTLKGIKPHGVKIEGYSLLIPLRDTEGTIHSLQRITWQGVKLNMRSGRVKGCYFSIGKPVDLLIVCEGFATGASLHECTGHAVAVAFNADNLMPVAVALRAKYPDLKIIIAADDDHQTPGNPGVTKGNAAARATGGGLAVPVFKESAA